MNGFYLIHRRKHNLNSFLIVLLLFIIGCKTTQKTNVPPIVITELQANSNKYRLVWNDDPATSMTIGWDQLDNGKAEVFYGPEDHKRNYYAYPSRQIPQTIRDKYGMHNNFAKLTGLLPDTRYYFVIRDQIGISQRYWFRTAPDKPKAITFITGGDTKSGGTAWEAGRASNRLVAKLRPLFVFFNGDFNSENGLNQAYWKQWLHDWHHQTTTQDHRMIPIIPVQGNHENGDQANLNYIFNAPYQQGDSSHIYYSISIGGDLLHLLALNSEIDEGGLQREWLEKNLKANQHFTFKIAGYHKPLWPHTSRKSENEYQFGQWSDLFYRYGLSISADGDSHMHKITYPLRPDSTSPDSFMGFIRDDRSGTMFVGEGSWGAYPRASDDDKPWTLASGSFNQFKWIHVFPKKVGEPAHMDIHTVISGEYNAQDSLILYDKQVKGLTEDNIFELPENINLYDNEGFGKVVKYPFYLNGK